MITHTKAFAAYLRGFETNLSNVHYSIKRKFAAYLRGFETGYWIPEWVILASRLQPTYEDLKLSQESFWEETAVRLQPTYEDLKRGRSSAP